MPHKLREKGMQNTHTSAETGTAQASHNFIAPAKRKYSLLEKAHGATHHIRIDGWLPVGLPIATLWGPCKVIGNYLEIYESATTEPYGV